MTLRRALRIAHHRVRSTFRKDAVDAEVAQELAFHFDQLVAENVAKGLPIAEARTAAHRELGNVAALQDECRDHRRVSWLHDLHQDIRYGCRTLARDRGFTVIAAASLALGLGATSAALSGLYAVMLGLLPFPAAERIAVLRTFPLDNPGQLSGVPLDDYFTWKDRSRSFEAFGVSLGFQADLGADERGAPAERLEGCLFDAGMMNVLGGQPQLGRLFTEDDPQFSTPGSVVVISDALWASRYGRDPGIVGKRVRLNRLDVTVIGVMPATFYFPDNRKDFWGPLRPVPGGPRGERLHNVVGRLRPGVRFEDAAAELGSLIEHDWGVRARGLRESMFEWAIAPLATIGGAAALVLLMACANVAALLLARGTGRATEIGLRMALGASRGRIIRQLLAESVLLGIVSSVLSLAVAWLTLRAFGLLAPLPGLPNIPHIDLNPPLVGLTALLGTLAGVVCGVVPALRSRGTQRASASGGSYKTTASAGQFRLRAMLVSVQVAASFILLVGATLLATSFARLAARDLNYDPQHLVTFDFRIPPLEFARPSGTGPDAQVVIAPLAAGMFDRVLDRMRALPGVITAAGISDHPTNSFVLFRAPLTIDGRPLTDGTPPAYFLVTPRFFEAMRTRIVRGREFTTADTISSPWAAVINETMAARFWPGQDPIGRQVRIGLSNEERPRQVIGVVRDIPTRRMQVVAEPVVYTSVHQQPGSAGARWVGLFGRMTFVVRTAGDATRLVPAIRNAVAELEPDRPIASVSSTTVQPYMWSRYSYVFVVVAFAIVATLIASFGVYGVMSYAVAQRSREIAIRLALGASTRDVLSTVGRQAFVVVAVGLITGVASALVGMRTLATILWGVAPNDPVTFVGIALLLTIVAGAACRAPIRRALDTDPVAALKCDGGS